MRNNPIGFNDPSGHSEECKHNKSECDEVSSSPEEILKKYHVTLDTKNGNWTEEAKWAAVIAVAKVAYRLSRNDKYGGNGTQAFVAVYDHVTFTWDTNCDGCRSGTKKNGEACGTDYSSEGCVPGGGVTSGAHSVTFASLSGQGGHEIDRMTKNIVHELGHAFYNGRETPPKLGHDYSRNALIPNLIYPGGERYDWQQHPPSMNEGGEEIQNELFADTFIAWTYDAWNKQNTDAVKLAQDAIGAIPLP